MALLQIKLGRVLQHCCKLAAVDWDLFEHPITTAKAISSFGFFFSTVHIIFVSIKKQLNSVEES